MKKVIIYLIFGLIPINVLFSNPIILPQAFISELMFDGNNNWILEISFQYSEPYYKQKYDSICIGTSGGFSRIKLENIKDGTNLFVITSDSLVTPLSINKSGDCIKLYSFLSSQYSQVLVDSLCFGNYPNSVIDSLQSGYSIERLFYNLYSKDKTPTIGLPNDTVGTCGTIKGYIYDNNNNPVTKGIFILDNPISIQNDGSYSTKVYSRKVTFKRMFYNYAPNTFQNVYIDSINLNINPDFIYAKDIHILSDLMAGVKEKKYSTNDDIKIMNYPNPFNSSTTFKIEVPSSFQNKQSRINIYNSLGKRILTINFRNNSQVIWDGKDFNGNSVSSGVYYYQLILANKKSKSGSMILLK